jgi:acid phosphatase
MPKHLLALSLLGTTALAAPAFAVPTYDHIVVVVEENHSLAQVVGNPNAPANYIDNTLLKEGTLLTNSHGTEHVSEPNYNDLFAGNPQGVGSTFVNGGGATQVQGPGGPIAVQTTNTSPVKVVNGKALTGNDGTIPGTSGDTIPLNTPNLGASLIRNGKSFAGYTEGLPFNGDRTDINGSVGTAANPIPASAVNNTTSSFARKHNVWGTWQGVNDGDPNVVHAGSPLTANQLSSSTNLTFNAFPGQPGGPSGFAALPTVSFVTPDQLDDEHDNPGNPSNFNSVADQWLKKNIDAYAQWALTHNSLLIVTWDEDNSQFFTKVDPTTGKTILTDALGNPLPTDAAGNPLAVDFSNNIPSILVGAGVKQDFRDNEFTDHCGILRTIEDSEGIGTLTNDPTQTCDVTAKALTQAFVPEPTSWSLLGGIPLVAWLRRRRVVAA